MKFISLNLDRTKDLIKSLVNGGDDPIQRTSELLLHPINGNITLYFSQSAASAVTVDWGDDSEPDIPTELNVTLSHHYSSGSEYTVKIYCAEGETWTPGFTSGSDHYGILGIHSDSEVYTALRKANLKSGAVLGAYSFTRCSMLTEVRLPQITSLPNYAFVGCLSLPSITIPNSVTSIGTQVFRGCVGLEEIIIPDSVLTILNAAFLRCTSLKRAIIGSKVTAIATQAFSNCTNLLQIISYNTTPPTLGTNAFGNLSENCVIYVPSESVEAYKTANKWAGYATQIQAIPT